MKTTVCTEGGGRAIADPVGGKVMLTIHAAGLMWGEGLACVELTQDQAGALIFALERAAEAARIAQERAGG
jgi:hypothetical protein